MGWVLVLALLGIALLLLAIRWCIRENQRAKRLVVPQGPVLTTLQTECLGRGPVLVDTLAASGNQAFGTTVYYQGNVLVYPPGVVPQFYTLGADGRFGPVGERVGVECRYSAGANAVANEGNVSRTAPLHCFDVSLYLSSHNRAQNTSPLMPIVAADRNDELSTPASSSKRREMEGSINICESSTASTTSAAATGGEVTPSAPLPSSLPSMSTQGAAILPPPYSSQSHAEHHNSK